MPTLERQPGASNHDVWCGRDTSGAWNFTYSTVAGAGSANNHKLGSGTRFTNITIPQGATIVAAYIVFTAFSDQSGTTVNSRISAEDVDDAPVIADDKAAFIARFNNHTTARVDWDSLPAWTIDTEYNSPELKTIIQEIVNRVGWASGNDILIFWEDYDDRSTQDAYRSAYSYDKSTTKCPKLHIEYTTVTTYTKTYTADALFKKLGLTKTLDANALFLATLTKQLQSDALFQAQGLTKSFLAKAIFGGANIQEITADALFKALGLTKALTADALFQQPGLTQELLADAIFKAVLLEQLTSDALFLARPTVTFTASARFGEAGIASFLASVYFKKLAYHTILDGQYITGSPELNRVYIIGRDAEGNPVFGTDHDQDEIDLVGERLDFQLELSIPTGSKAADVADAMLKKMRLTNKRGFILIPPNCGAELWDVVQITDKLCAQSGQKYRIIGIHFDYEPLRTHYHHRLLLGAV